MRTSITLTILLFAAGLAVAEPSKPLPPVTIETLVAQALAENPELRFYEAEIAAAKGEKRTAGAWQNPEIAGELGAKRTVGDGLDAAGVVWAASVQQTFEWPGRVSLRKAIANRQVKLAEHGLQQFRSSLAAAVRQKAYALLAAQQREIAAREVSARGEELVATLVQREPAGVAPLLETRAIEASVLKLKRAGILAAKEAQAALFELNALRGRLLAEPVTIAPPSTEFPALPPLAELLKRSTVGNFELLQRQTELEQQGFKVRLAENETWPSITTGPVIEQEYAGDQETRAALVVSLPLPLWNQNKGNIESAKAREIQAQAVLQLSHREVERNIREAATAYELHRKEMQRWNPKVAEELREAAELADRHYRLGAVPLATYLEVQGSYLEALDAIYSTRADALQELAELELLTGKQISNTKP
jgi:cobalt-zinc-cadmium efflux system outer membrane protein